jgi:hypothetical protein
MTKLNTKFVETVCVDSGHWTWVSDGQIWTSFAVMTEVENKTEVMKRARTEVSPTPGLNTMEREGSVSLNDAKLALEGRVVALLCACTSKYCFGSATFAREPEAAMMSIGKNTPLESIEVLGEVFHHH